MADEKNSAQETNVLNTIHLEPARQKPYLSNKLLLIPPSWRWKDEAAVLPRINFRSIVQKSNIFLFLPPAGCLFQALDGNALLI